MFNLALANKRISAVPRIYVPTSPKDREVYLTKEEFETLFGAKGMEKKFHPVLIFLFYQAVRIGEALSIEWRQLDLNAGVFLPKAINNKKGNTDPKSLHNEVIRALRPMQQAEGLVFEGISQKMFEKAFRRVMLRLGYGKPTWQCSQCRHTKNAPAPKTDDPAIVCDYCKENAMLIPMQYHYVGPSPQLVA
jgi:integrase